jgi:hypothetical protein
MAALYLAPTALTGSDLPPTPPALVQSLEAAGSSIELSKTLLYFVPAQADPDDVALKLTTVGRVTIRVRSVRPLEFQASPEDSIG